MRKNGATGDGRRNADAIIHAALDGGINFIDTADAYSGGESEEIVGRALQGRRDDVVLATKVHFPMSADPNNRGNSRRWIVREVENSLRRLRTDYIDPPSAAAPRPAAPPPDRPAHQPLTRDRLRPAARSPHRPREDDGEGRDRHGPGRFCRERF